MLLRNGFFPLLFILRHEIKASKRCASIYLRGITAKMGKNFAVDEAVVGMIKRNCSRSVVHVVGACHKCQINFKWSNDTTTEGKVEGVHKDGLVGEIRRYNKQKSCDLGENAE